MNPLDLSGPAFLLLYLVLLAFVVVLRWYALGLGRQSSPELSTAPLSPYEVAFLAGGPEAVVDAAVTTLSGRGWIDVKERLHRGASSGWSSQSATRSTLDVGPHDRELESEILQHLPPSGIALGSLRAVPLRAAQAIETRLAELGLLVPPETRKLQRALGVFPVFALLALGGLKMLVGLTRDKPVAFLFLLLLGTGIYAAIVQRASAPRVTARGAKRLEYLRDQNAALRLTLFSAPQQVLPEEAALAYGLFGASMLTGSLAVVGAKILSLGSPVDLELARLDAQLRASFRQPSGGTDSGSATASSCSGSSCGGSSCSGGCGGGGGGGCGGCSS